MVDDGFQMNGNDIGRNEVHLGQIWTMNMGGGQEESTGLYKVEIKSGLGSGVKILNRPAPPAFQEGVIYAEQNLYSKAKELIGDRA